MSAAVPAGRDRWLAATVAVLFAVSLVALPLNLAHHLHHHGGAKAPSCPFLALAQHTPHASGVTVEMPEPEDIGWLEPPARLTTVRVQPITVSPARAPPSVSLSA